MAQAGRHNFLDRLTGAMRGAGLNPEYRDNSYAERLATGALPGWSMFEMEPPEGPRSLVFRRAYVAPFWQIDATDRRWDWTVAQNRFHLTADQRPEARRFAAYWRRRIYQDQTDNSVRGGAVFVPLQARLTECRPFQSMSPIAMLESLLARYPDRRIVATLHPKLTPTDDETAALARLTARHPRLAVERRASADMLARCDFVATQNSAAAFEALFFRKRVLLFAGIDFHHPFASVWRDGEDAAYASLATDEPDFDGYLFWYLQGQSLNAGREDFGPRALARLAALGMVPEN